MVKRKNDNIINKYKMNRELMFALLIGEPYLYGNPGNVSVMCQLCEKNFDTSMYVCETAFKKKHLNKNPIINCGYG